MTNDWELEFTEFSQLCRVRLEKIFENCLRDIPSITLKQAMQYTLQHGGKRIRPLLTYATGVLFDAPLESLDLPAAAVEMIHTYSLIHDDLPCMDNADLRRGQPTCHKQFGEDMAVLAGDALQTLAFEVITAYPAPLNTEKRFWMLNQLLKTCGPRGLILGQSLDMTLMNDPSISKELLLNIYQLKTGALLSTCLELGRAASSDDDEINQRALKRLGSCIGLAFQIQDDILDIEAPTKNLGKSQGMDKKNNKMTYPKIVGLNAAKEKVNTLYREALESINYLGNKAQLLRQLIHMILVRQR